MRSEKLNVIISDGIDDEIFKELQEMKDISVHKKMKLSRKELIEEIPHANILIVRSSTKVDEELLSYGSSLKLVIRAGEGIDNIDRQSCKQKKIKLSNVPGANSNAAAEQAIALIFSLLRETPRSTTMVKNGYFDRSQFSGTELWQKTVGIVGFGKIGRLLAKRLSGFEPEILYYDTANVDSEAKKVTLEKLFTSSDIISIHLPLMDSTKKIIGKELINLMKPSAYLINAARGALIDETALYEALRDKKIAGAGLDVFTHEPIEKDNPLLSLENIVLAPHLGANTKEASRRVGLMVLSQIRSYIKEGIVLNEII